MYSCTSTNHAQIFTYWPRGFVQLYEYHQNPRGTRLQYTEYSCTCTVGLANTTVLEYVIHVTWVSMHYIACAVDSAVQAAAAGRHSPPLYPSICEASCLAPAPRDPPTRSVHWHSPSKYVQSTSTTSIIARVRPPPSYAAHAALRR